MRILSAAILAAAALLASCSYLLDDPYPKEAQRLLARVDLGDKAKAAGASSSIQELGALSYLESSGSSVLFVELRMKDGTHLLLSLDGDRLDGAKAFRFSDYALGSGVSLTASGEYVSGGVAFSADLVPSAIGVTAPNCVLRESGSNYFLTFASPLLLNIGKYDADYASTGSTSIPVASSGNWQLIAAAQGGGRYCLLFQNYDTGCYRAFRTSSMKALYSAAAASAWTSLFGGDVPDWHKGPTLRSDYGSAWLTVDGTVYRSSEDDGTTLTLKRFSGSIESYTLEKSSGEVLYFFEPSGRYWFMYERESGRLSKLRTWW
jgi:hypothetical protein